MNPGTGSTIVYEDNIIPTPGIERIVKIRPRSRNTEITVSLVLDSEIIALTAPTVDKLNKKIRDLLKNRKKH